MEWGAVVDGGGVTLDPGGGDASSGGGDASGGGGGGGSGGGVRSVLAEVAVVACVIDGANIRLPADTTHRPTTKPMTAPRQLDRGSTTSISVRTIGPQHTAVFALQMNKNIKTKGSVSLTLKLYK